MKKYTMQEAFDKAATHLLTQRVVSRNYIDDGFFCCYRGPGGLKCAIGVLLEDSEVPTEVGTSPSVSSLKSTGRLPASLTDLPVDFLQDLQGVHDSYDPSRWHDRLCGVARFWGLDTNVMEKAVVDGNAGSARLASFSRIPKFRKGAASRHWQRWASYRNASRKSQWTS